MSTPYFIDGVVRHASWLVAATAATHGTYLNLGHLPQLFEAELFAGLRHHGLTWRVIADLMGGSSSAVFERARRKREAHRYRGFFTRWRAVVDYIREEGGATRAEVGHRFREEPSDMMAEILRGLMRMEILAETGDRRRRRLIVNPERAEQSLAEMDDHLVMLALYDAGAATHGELVERLGLEKIRPAIARLDASLGRLTAAAGGEEAVIQTCTDDGETVYRCERLYLKGDDTAGMYAGIYDHLQTVHRLLHHFVTAEEGERRGWGSTYTFTIRPGNPLAAEVESRLDGLRDEMSALRERLDEGNEGLPTEGAKSISLYMGRLDEAGKGA